MTSSMKGKYRVLLIYVSRGCMLNDSKEFSI